MSSSRRQTMVVVRNPRSSEKSCFSPSIDSVQSGIPGFLTCAWETANVLSLSGLIPFSTHSPLVIDFHAQEAESPTCGLLRRRHTTTS